MGYADIPSSETDPESPLTTGLMTKYVNNLLQVEQWIRDRLDDEVISNWTPETSGMAGDIFDAHYDDTAKRWVIVGAAGEMRRSDDDGVSWAAVGVNPYGANNINGVYHSGVGLWVSVGLDTGNAGAASSADGNTWVLRDANLTGAEGRAVVHDEGATWVVVGDGGDISTSPDGTTWTARNSGVATRLNGVCFGAGLFVAVGDAGVIQTSPDGLSNPWDTRVSGFGALNIHDVHYGGGLFVAVGEDGKFATSTDGITWAFDDSGIGAGNDLRGVHYDTERWVAVADDGSVISSASGTSWVRRGGSADLYRVSRNGAPCWMIVGGGPVLLTSLCDPNRQVIP